MNNIKLINAEELKSKIKYELSFIEKTSPILKSDKDYQREKILKRVLLMIKNAKNYYKKARWEWIEEKPDKSISSCGWRCTNCKEFLEDVLRERIKAECIFNKPNFKYCPNCGAEIIDE